METAAIDDINLVEGNKKSDTMLERLFSWMHPLSIWVAILVSLALYTMGSAIANSIIILFMFWQIWSKKSFWPYWITFHLFLSIGLFAAHRFDPSKSFDWLLGSVLPFALISLLLQYITRINLWSKVGRKTCSLLMYRIKLHPLPGTLLFVCAIIWGVGDYVQGWLGFIIITLVAVMMESNKLKATMVILYAAMLHLFVWKGMITLYTDTIQYLTIFVDRIVFPIAMLVFLILQNGTDKDANRELRIEVQGE
ncbi:hypothetical protein [Paenibacillus jiagnxiensis]|uniref:hypothetical protein n=1 Tax=Paenibacillus jiagnxiensis TaxID=3228926 RepID=UPI0033BA8DEE